MFQDLSLTTLEISLFGVCTLNRSQCKLCSITTVPFDKMLHYYNGVPSHQTLTDLTRNSLYNFEHFLKKIHCSLECDTNLPFTHRAKGLYEFAILLI